MSTTMTRRRLLAGLGGLALVPLAGPGARPGRTTFAGSTMGTDYRIVVRPSLPAAAGGRLGRAVEASLARTEALMSIHRGDSELARFNRSAATTWQSMSPDSCRVLGHALRVRQRSAGAFDPAAAPLVAHWGFGPGRNAPPRVPESPRHLREAIAAARVEVQGDRARKSHADVAIDLNGIAKGDGLDQVARLLEQRGVSDYLIEIGGELRVGAPRWAPPWRIGIEHPQGGLVDVLALDRGAVATSGDYVDYYERGGRRYCHVVDPRSGQPVDHGLALVTVVAPSAMAADAWSTALLVLGPDAGFELATRDDLAALFLIRGERGWRRRETTGFTRLRRQSTQRV